MPDLNIVPGSVAQITNSGSGTIPTVTARGIAGAAITPGQVLYADPTASNTLKPAQATVALQAANVVGIALGSAALNQPLTYATGGDILLPTAGTGTGGGTVLLSGSVYILSAGTAGNLISTADPAIASVGGGTVFSSVIGLGNGTATATITSTLRLNLIPAAASKLG